MAYCNEMEFKSNEELLMEYKLTKDEEVKQEIVLRYIDTIRVIAHQMRDVYISFTQLDDIVNEGVIAVIKAIDKFDPEKNVKFETYISKRIRGLIIDIARKQDWVPRSIRKANKDINIATETLYAKTGKTPTANEVADFMGMSVQKYWEQTSKNNIFGFLSLDTILEEAGEIADFKRVSSLESDRSPESTLLELEMDETLKKGLNDLRERERSVIDMYYHKNLSMKEIAAILNVSEPRISQIHAAAIKKLRGSMKEYMQH
ncbi:MAG: FliA/WhiG family RNA polymerase sigma factor [Peptostreptococcaceae bacterium]|nr:FliA/WhiG family RNA polymerase sigma factor [Peptostreptococcaceae bacterium]